MSLAFSSKGAFASRCERRGLNFVGNALDFDGVSLEFNLVAGKFDFVVISFGLVTSRFGEGMIDFGFDALDSVCASENDSHGDDCDSGNDSSHDAFLR